MQIIVFDYQVVNDNVYVNGVRTRKFDDKYVQEIVKVRFKKDNFYAIVPEHFIVPFIVDIKFEKGKGAYVQERD